MTKIRIINTPGYLACGDGTHVFCGTPVNEKPKSGKTCQCGEVEA